MSSLLGGIKFIPREKCPQTGSGGSHSEEESSSSDDDRSKKKHRKRHRHEHKKSGKTSKRDKHGTKKEDRKSKRSILSYSSGSKPSETVHQRAAAPSWKQIQELSDSENERDKSNDVATGRHMSMQEKDFGRFNGASRGAEFYDSLSDRSSNEGADDRECEPLVTRYEEPNTVVKDNKDNQSIAAILRAKLKASKEGLLPSAATGSDTAGGSQTLNVVDTDPYSIAKRLMLNKKKENSLREDALASVKRRKISNSQDTADVGLTRSDMFNMKAEERWTEKNMDDIFVSNVLRLGEHYKGTELGGTIGLRADGQTGLDEEDEVDMKMFQASEDKLTAAQRLAQDQQRSIKQQLHLDGIISRCFNCIDSARHNKALTISVGEYTYLRIKPSHLSFVKGQCEIVPISHSSSILRAGEEALIEVERYKSCLRSMFEREGKCVVFLESSVRQKSVSKSGRKNEGVDNLMASDASRHTHIDVIPVRSGDLKAAMAFFREAFLECDAEWSTHKKIIDLDGSGSGSNHLGALSKKVPAHMNYVSVEWEGGGYAHVVEDEELFNEDFCLDIMSGFFQDVPFHMKRRQPVDSTEDNKRLKSFKEKWSMYDWVAYALESATTVDSNYDH